MARHVPCPESVQPQRAMRPAFTPVLTFIDFTLTTFFKVILTPPLVAVPELGPY